MLLQRSARARQSLSGTGYRLGAHAFSTPAISTTTTTSTAFAAAVSARRALTTSTRPLSIDLTKRNVQTRSYSTASTKMYTASFAFFEAIYEAGVTHCFVNLGSDHPSIIEAMVKGKREANGKFPRIITCPNEVRPFRSHCSTRRITHGPLTNECKT